MKFMLMAFSYIWRYTLPLFLNSETCNLLRWCPNALHSEIDYLHPYNNGGHKDMRPPVLCRSAMANWKSPEIFFYIFLSPPLCSITITKSITLQCIYGYYKTFIIMRLPAPGRGPAAWRRRPLEGNSRTRETGFPRFSTRPTVFRARQVRNSAPFGLCLR